MISNAIMYNEPFGIVLQDSDNLYKIGCQATVSNVINSYPSGESDIIVQGTNRFEINKTLLEGKTIIGYVNMLINEKINNHELIDEINENYLKILLRMGITNNLENDLGLFKIILNSEF